MTAPLRGLPFVSRERPWRRPIPTPSLPLRARAIRIKRHVGDFASRVCFDAAADRGAVNNLAALCAHPVLRRQKAMTHVGLTLDLPARAIRSDAPTAPRGPAPRIGQQSAAIRKDFSL